MEKPKCPACGYRPVAALFFATLKCAQCGANLSSNLRWVSLLEWLVGGGVLTMIGFALHELNEFKSWSYAELMSLFFLPACLIHLAVILKFVKLRLR